MICRSRSRMAFAPLVENVRQRILLGRICVFARIFATRIARVCVFPVPGPATTITGPSIESTACFCAVLRLRYAVSNSGVVRGFDASFCRLEAVFEDGAIDIHPSIMLKLQRLGVFLCA